MTAVQPRVATQALPPYRPGRSAEQAAAEHGLAVAIKLASNEAPYPPLPSVAHAMREMVTCVNRYPDPRAGQLRGLLAETYDVPLERVTVGAGSAGLLFQLVEAFVEAGEEIVFPWLSFEAYPIIAQVAGGVPVRVPLNRETADVEALLGAIAESTKVLILAEPNNPTGTVVGQVELRRLLRGIPETCLVVLDEAYFEFADRSDQQSTLDIACGHENVVVLRTFSKAFGLAGLRVGYAFAAPTIIELLERVAVPFAVNSVAQAAATASLKAREDLDYRINFVLGERRRVQQQLRSAGWGMPDTQANFVWLPAGDGSEELAGRLERQGVVTRPFARDGVRVTIGSREENDRFLEAFERIAAHEAIADAWRGTTGIAASRVGEWLEELPAGDLATDSSRAAYLTLTRATGSDLERAQLLAPETPQLSPEDAVQRLEEARSRTGHDTD